MYIYVIFFVCIYIYIFLWSSVYKYVINQWRRSRSILSTQQAGERKIDVGKMMCAVARALDLAVARCGGAGGSPRRRRRRRAAAELVESHGGAGGDGGRGGEGVETTVAKMNPAALERRRRR